MSELQPILVPISQASAIIGKCRRGIYQLIATDQLKAVKVLMRTIPDEQISDLAVYWSSVR